jgi:hypothetical protein
MGSTWVDFAGVGLIGGILGLCELLARYRDEPGSAVVNPAAALYIATNVVAALVALGLLNIFRVDFGIPAAEPGKLRVVLILVGGLGAMAFFRSSLFTFKLGDKDVPLGPGLVLQILLDVTDREVDRGRAGPRAVAITEIMAGIDFDKAKAALPAYCFGLMQNVSGEEQSAVGQQVAKLDSAAISPSIRSYLLGLLVLNIVGETVLRAAIKSLDKEIR